MGGVYLHIPFCFSKCPYCDFYSYRANDEAQAEYVSALTDEITTLRRCFEFTGGSFGADTLYFGGGTPSLLTGEQLLTLTEAARKSFSLPADAEITLEMNPAGEAEAIIPYIKEAGINRISLGMQSAVDSERRALGRLSDSKRISEVIGLLRNNGIENISLDIMLGIPNQTEKSLNTSLEFIRSENVPHVSAYMLTIEEGTQFYKRKDSLKLPDEDTTVKLYEQCLEYLNNIGIKQYEISNFAVPGFESKHNQKYWQLDEYLGLGPAAHSFIGNKRFFFLRDTEKFILGAPPVFDATGGDSEEYIMLRLRLTKGITLSDFSAVYGDESGNALIKKALPLKEQGLLNIEDDRIALTLRGFLLSNSVISALI